MTLKRELGLLEATLYGIGIILGAGVYALIGVGAGLAGNAVWISFGIAAFIAGITGLSYAELSSLYPRDAAEYVYTKNAFKNKFFSFQVEWMMLFTVIVSSATVALGFGGYFEKLTGITSQVSAFFLIAILSLVNYFGIKFASRLNSISTILEIIGLVIVCACGAFFIGEADYFYSPTGISGILSATGLIFFAFIGFESLANLSEETKNASKLIPKAMVISLCVSTVLYIMVALSAVSILGWEELSKSNAPLTSVVEKVFPGGAVVVSFIALFATGNTVLAMLLVASRLIYGLSENKSIPKIFKVTGKQGTPYIAIVLTMGLAIGALLIGDIQKTAELTDFSIFLVYSTVNLSLIVLRFRNPDKRTFKTPLNIGKFPVLAAIGLASTLLMLLKFPIHIAQLNGAIIVAGSIVFFILQDA